MAPCHHFSLAYLTGRSIALKVVFNCEPTPGLISPGEFKRNGRLYLIPKAAIQANQGTITVNSTVNKGSVFKVKIPLYSADPEQAG